MPTLIRGARQLLTPLRLIPNAAILIDNGIIVEVGPASRIERLNAARKAQTVDADGRVIIPAFVDASAALLSSPHIHKWSAQRMDFEARRRLDAFIRNGTTTIGATCDVADETVRGKALRVLHRLDGDPVRIVTNHPPAPLNVLTPAHRFARGESVSDMVPEEFILGSGYDAETCPIVSMPFAVSLAITQLKRKPEDAIAAATIRAAYALGVESRCGSLEAGKDADLLILDTADYRELPWIAHAAPVALTLRKGRPLFRKEPVRC